MKIGHGHGQDAFTGPAVLRYNSMARRWLRWLYRGLARDAARAIPGKGTVLDVGTGPGVLLAELARLRPDLELIGVDLSADMVSVAQQNLAPYAPRATARVADVAALPLPDGSIDLAVSSLSSHHWADIDAAVAELARVLRPGGTAYVYDMWLAPFGALTAAARSRSLFAGSPPRRSMVRIGGIPLPGLTRLALRS